MSRLTTPERDALLARYTGLIQATARKYLRRTPGVELRDMVSAVTVAFLEAAARFEAGGRWTFGAFVRKRLVGAAHNVMRHEITRGVYVTRAKSNTHDTLAACRPRSFLTGEDGDGDIDPALIRRAEAEANAYPPEWWDECLRPLSPRERQVILLLYRDGLSRADVARALGVKGWVVKNTHTIAMSRLRGDRPAWVGRSRTAAAIGAAQSCRPRFLKKR